jgi:hypothetical protein
MSTTTSTNAHRLSSVDDILGRRDTRFFGEGFKRVRQRLSRIDIRPTRAGTPGTVQAAAGIDIPGLWSQKGVVTQVPHLSTIDAMLLSGRLTGLYLAHVHRLPPGSAPRLEALKIKAGTTPDEEALDHFDVSGLHRSTVPSGNGTARTVMDCRIGSMTVAVTAVHEDLPARTDAAELEDGGDLPGPWNDRPFGADHRYRSQLLTDVAVDGDSQTAEAELRLAADPDAAPTMIDLFAASLQLGQILLYKLDTMRREDSRTLWMRRTAITASPVPEAAERRLRVALTRPTLLPTTAGTWRAAQISSAFSGIDLTCNVAHLIPAPAAGER